MNCDQRPSTSDSNCQTDFETPRPCVNPGNPVFSCMTPPTAINESLGAKPPSILFKTTSKEYGALAPSYEMAPCVYYPNAQYFSDHLGKCGMYQNNSLNTMLDKSKVYDHPNIHNTL